jgi:WD40 repeat protein
MSRYSTPSSAWLFGSLLGALVIAACLGTSPIARAQPPVTALAFAPSDDLLVAGSQAGIRVVAWPSLEIISEWDTGVGQVHDFKFSPDGRLLLIVGGAAGQFGQWELVSWPDLEPIASTIAHGDVIHSAAWLSDGRFVTGAADNDLIEWRRSGGEVQQLATLQGHSRRVLCVEATGQNLLASAGVDQVLRVWESSDGRVAERPLRSLDNHTGIVCDLAARPGDHAVPVLASASVDKTVRLWQPSIGRLVRFARLPVEPCSLAWRPDGERLAVGCADGKLRIINPNNVEVEQTLDALDGWVFEVAAAADGSFAVGGTAGALKRVIPQDRLSKSTGS